MRKGQYFIIGAVFLCLAISYILLSQQVINIEVSPSDKNTFDNIKDDFPNVVNIILQENKTTSNLEEDMLDYFKFLDDYAKRHAMNLTGYFIIGLPYKEKTTKKMNVTIGNFRKENINNFKIVLDGKEYTINTMENNNITSLNYTLDNNYFEVKYNFSELGENVSFETSHKLFEVFEITADIQDKVWKDRIINK